jgi:DNA-binding MarR family transcriptional regulator
MDKAKLIKGIVELQRQAGRILGQYAASVWIDSGLTLAQLKSLFLITKKGSTNFKKLAEALGVTPASVTRIVDRLVEQGLVSRREDPKDRRMMVLRPTDKGQTIITNLRESGINRMTRILMLLSLEELDALSQGLSAFIRAAKAYKGETHP